MTKPMHKSGSMRKVKRRTPGGKVSLQHRRSKPSIAKCGNCGAKLSGVARERPSKMTRMPKTKKRPERPFGGNLCTKCLRVEMKTKARE